MNITFTRHTDSRHLLLIMAGWGMDDTPFRSLSLPGYDIAVAYDYTDESFDARALAGYREIIVAAWSMGVMEAARIFSKTKLPVTLTIAINGTPRPVSDTEGIPVNIFKGTLDNLSDATLSRFNRRMCGSTPAYVAFNEVRPARTIDSLRDELRVLGERANLPASPFNWDVAVIGSNDMIFPAANQHNAWRDTRTVTIDAPHLVDFQKIFERFVVNKSRVAQRFGNTRQSYDIEATVQSNVARNLATRLLDVIVPGTTIPRAIEIGAGNSSLTRLYIDNLEIGELELWDLTLPLMPTDARCKVIPVADDAEARLRELPDNSIDLIVSSSTLQWFNSPVSALRDIQRVLAPDGTAAISLYTEGTLSRLSAETGVSLNYVSETKLNRAVTPTCNLDYFATDTLNMEFGSTRQLLEHMRSTGVDAVGHATTSSLRNLIRDNSLRHLQFNATTLIISKR